VWHTADDVGTKYAYTFNADGLVVDYTTSTAGPDLSFGTADDVMLQRQVTTYEDAGNRIETLGYNDPGPDGVWMTADDIKNLDYLYDTSL